MEVDYIIVGQGLCGTFLSWYLQQAGARVLIIDEDDPFSASKVASGVINPVTGRRIVTTWMIDELLPFAHAAYTQIGDDLEAALVRQCGILDFHPTEQMQTAFAKRAEEDDTYLHVTGNEEPWEQYFNFNFGIGEIMQSLLVDVGALLHLWRRQLSRHNAILMEPFSRSSCAIYDDHVTYGGYTAKAMIMCDGAKGANDPYFRMLPYALDKGEVIIASIPGLPQDHIYKQGISIVPWRNGLFWIGSTYEWKYTDLQPTAIFRKRVEAALATWVKLPYTITDHWVSERPTNLERRPFVGMHPVHKSMGILNGMGTKGCSLAPYFAKQLTDNLLYDKPVSPEADVSRFSNILRR